jgi:hypothetical protein
MATLMNVAIQRGPNAGREYVAPFDLSSLDASTIRTIRRHHNREELAIMLNDIAHGIDQPVGSAAFCEAMEHAVYTHHVGLADMTKLGLVIEFNPEM